MNHILVISGPTATGKTALALNIAKKFNGQLISADSRQVYQGLDIGTGKDHPPQTTIHLIDIIAPNQRFSVAEYQRLALAKVQEIIFQGQLPIIVGGTGQYIDAILHPQPTFTIKPNRVLRFFLNKFPLSLLQFTLKTLDFKTFNSLNDSDIANPHRLIRKIEIPLSNKKKQSPPLSKGGLRGDLVLHLSLTAPNSYLYPKIDQRVRQRLAAGLFTEVKNLLKQYSWSAPGLNTLAYKEFRTGFTSTNVEKWRFDEHALVRRQKTWFKKQKDIIFIDVSRPGFEHQATAAVSEFLKTKN